MCIVDNWQAAGCWDGVINRWTYTNTLHVECLGNAMSVDRVAIDRVENVTIGKNATFHGTMAVSVEFSIEVDSEEAGDALAMSGRLSSKRLNLELNQQGIHSIHRVVVGSGGLTFPIPSGYNLSDTTILDADADGCLNAAEFSVLSKVDLILQPSLFWELPFTDDDCIDRVEYQTLMSPLPFDEKIKQIDLDADGCISRDELEMLNHYFLYLPGAGGGCVTGASYSRIFGRFFNLQQEASAGTAATSVSSFSPITSASNTTTSAPLSTPAPTNSVGPNSTIGMNSTQSPPTSTTPTPSGAGRRLLSTEEWLAKFQRSKFCRRTFANFGATNENWFNNTQSRPAPPWIDANRSLGWPQNNKAMGSKYEANRTTSIKCRFGNESKESYTLEVTSLFWGYLKRTEVEWVHSVYADYLSGDELRCKAPAHAEGFADVEISLNSREYTSQEKLAYIYYTAPSVSRIKPSGGPIEGDTVVTIFGTGMRKYDGLVLCRFGDESFYDEYYDINLPAYRTVSDAVPESSEIMTCRAPERMWTGTDCFYYTFVKLYPH